MVVCFESVLDEHIWMQKIKYVVLKDLTPKTGKGYDLVKIWYPCIVGDVAVAHLFLSIFRSFLFCFSV